MKKTISIFLMIYILIFTGCEYRTQSDKMNAKDNVTQMEMRKDTELNIVTTDKLLYYTVKDIVKDRHNISYIFKNRSDELNFKFTNDSLNNIAKNDLLIYMGVGFEPWIDSFVDKLNKSNVSPINVSRGVKIISYDKEVKVNDTVIRNNPYYLMNMDNYRVVLMNIKNSIEDRDPKNRDIYEKNFAATLKNIDDYKKQLNSITDSLSGYTFLTSEDGLNYFTRNSGLNTIDMNKDISDKSELDSRIKSSDNIVFLYNSSSALKDNEDIIKKYNMKTLNMMIYDGQSSYDDCVKYNLNSFKNFYSSIQSDKK
ncbi:zinc ABC transporter substrate-binding protein [Clostridium fermenticellae]|uniref:Zinc ABC transporter substrate-binding protein n=1 Tax=Clostridium fermenticellae TaxID=2068654 RepID=A0A386H597_9CLOT|nr:metal ABC transporter substrate-binding protein [Clostridium fermenticellae]AYD40830.1 zinc ABC transporter substrate-binding protein [Clostridium fermenticellae]